MDTTPNKYITVAYELYTDFDGKRELVEKAPIEHPFQFISDMGTTLDAFEAQIKPLQKGEKFNFTLSVEEAYGEYEQERVLELNKDVFKVNGHFDKEHIYPGSVVPLMNADGARFNGTITDVKEDTVTRTCVQACAPVTKFDRMVNHNNTIAFEPAPQREYDMAARSAAV